MIGKKIGLTAFLLLSILCICIGSVSAETYNYAGSDGDWQGQLTLTVNEDGSMLLNGASVTSGTILEQDQADAGTFGTDGDCACQALVMSGSQGYAGTGGVDANGNSAGAQVSFTNGNNVIVEQYADIYTPEKASELYGEYPPGLEMIIAGQHVSAGSETPYGDSYFETLFASTSAHNADGSSAGVIAQATSTGTGPYDGARFHVSQIAETETMVPVGYAGSYGGAPYSSYTEAHQEGSIRNAGSANIQAYAATPDLFTSGSISVVDGNLRFWDGMNALTVEGSGFRTYGTSETGSRSIALVHADDVEVSGQSGGSNVVSTYANGDSASVATSFLMTGGYKNTYSSDYHDLNYNLIGLGVSNDPRSLVWARTNIGERSTSGFGTSDPIDDIYITVGAQNSEGDSAGHTFIDPLRNVGGGTGIIRGNENTFSWARYWPRVLPP